MIDLKFVCMIVGSPRERRKKKEMQLFKEGSCQKVSKAQRDEKEERVHRLKGWRTFERGSP